tara:strand:- start:454 stop:672 length:219 start_codon:yes stop_codon:yes gene_type:complete
MKTLAIIALLALGGCSLIGSGKDDSRLRVGHQCDVDIRQHAKVGGNDSTEVVETVTVLPDCTVTVNFKQHVR